MARGQLGNNILAHYAAHPEAQTIKQVKDALNASSPGAIGYALDKLVEYGKMVKLDGRPARYAPADGAAPVSAKEPESAPAAKRTPRAEPEDEPVMGNRKRARNRMPCGFCMTTKNMQYHLDNCPVKIARAQLGEEWHCPCAEDGHKRASDYDEYMAEMKADAEERVLRRAKGRDTDDGDMGQPDGSQVGDIG